MRRAAFLLLVAVGCGSPPAPPKPAVRPVGPKPVVAAAVPLEPRAEEVYAYSAIGKRDPFRSPLDDLIIAKQGEAQCPLCRWEIDQLKLVAVVTGTGNPVAMVEDPDGVGHVVRQGTQVGKRNGKVTVIRRDELVVSEVGHDPFGKALANKSVLKIEHNPAEALQAASLLDE